MAFLYRAVPDPRRAGDLLEPLLAAGVDGERGLQQLPLQLPPRLRDLRLPVPVIQGASIAQAAQVSIDANCPAGAASAAASSPLTGHEVPSSPVIVTVTETASSIAGPPPAEGSFPSTIPEPARKPAEPAAGQRQEPPSAARRRHA